MVAVNLQPVTDITLTEQLQERIKNYILQNHLQPGEKLPTEETLAQSFGVSRAAVREALRSLESLGIVEARQGVGRVVCDFDFETILSNLSYSLAFHNNSMLHMNEIRKALDLHFVDAMVRNLSEKDLDDLSQIVAHMQNKQASEHKIEDEDYAFHRLLIERSGNPIATQLFEIAWQAKERAYSVYDWQQFDNSYAMHSAILLALRHRDAAAAREAMLAHYQVLEKRLKQHIKLASTLAG